MLSFQRSASLLEQAAFQIEDVVQELQHYLNQIQYDEPRLAVVEERLDLINKLKRKYGGSLDAVMAHLSELDNELSSLDTLAEDIADAEKKVDAFHRELEAVARELSHKRKDACKQFSRQVEKALVSLNMPHTRFAVSLDAHSCKTQTDERLATWKASRFMIPALIRPHF